MVYQTEKQLKEFADRIPAEIKAPVEEGIAKLKKSIESNDTEQMKKIMQEIEQDLMKFGQHVYQQAGANAGATGEQQKSGDNAGGPGNPGRRRCRGRRNRRRG
jgi:molecular chaperone DnaK